VDDYGPQGRSEWRDVDWGHHQRWLEIDGAPVNVIDVGEGPALLFVHGLSGCWQNWLEQIPHFARTRRVVAPDLPGFGASPLPREDVSISGYARCLDAILGQLGVEAADVVGNSLGGFVANELAISFPQRVRRLVLVSASGLSAAHVKRDPTQIAARVAGQVLAVLATRREWIFRRPQLRNAFAGYVIRHPERLPTELLYEQLEAAAAPGFLPATLSSMQFEIEDRLAEIDEPTLIVWGREDKVVPPHDAPRFEELIPGAKLVWFEDTGHVPMLERPARFNRVVDEFLGDQLVTAPSEALETSLE
jgi:pimeloyl-ACP methyl ester carboxylesterase